VEVGWVVGVRTYFWWEGADAAVDDLLGRSEVYWWCFGFGHGVLGGWLRPLLMLMIQIRGLEMLDRAVALELETPKISRIGQHCSPNPHQAMPRKDVSIPLFANFANEHHHYCCTLNQTRESMGVR
jgi:hypothetical protein